MAQLWGGRFTKDTDQLVYNFNASISFDKKFYKQDMEGSIAHVKMLGKQGILEAGEAQEIVEAIKEIMREVDEGKLKISHVYEDIHSVVEAFGHAPVDAPGSPGDRWLAGRPAARHFDDYGTEYRYFYARLYPSAESAACYISAPHGRLF